MLPIKKENKAMIAFNRLIAENYPDSDVKIIKTFYAGVKAWMEANPDENMIETADQINLLCQYYTLTLSAEQKQRAKELAYLIISKPQILPRILNYIDILKATLLMAIPDLLLFKHCRTGWRGTRSDGWLGSFTYIIQPDESYKLYPGLTTDISAFENFIVDHEIALGEKSVFHKFADYLLRLNRLNQSTITHCSQMFLDDVVKNINTLLSDRQLATAFLAADIHPVEWIDILHKIHAWHLSAYILQKLHAAGEKEQRYAKINYHLNVLQKIIYGFTINRERHEPIIEQYIQCVKFNVNLGCSPAITTEEIQRQKFVYELAVKARDAIASGDSKNLRNTSQILGLSTEETPRTLICDNYFFSDKKFYFPDVTTETSSKEILIYFFLSNVNFLRQIDERQYGRDQYKISIERLWHAFIHNPRCPRKIKDRGITIDVNAPLPIELDIIDRICKPGHINDDIINEASEILYRSARLEKNRLLLAFAKAFFVGVSAPMSNPACSENFTHDCITAFISEKLNGPDLQATSSIRAMSILLRSSIKLRVKLKLIGAISAGKLENIRDEASEETNLYYRLASFRSIEAAENISDIFGTFLTEPENTYFSAFSTKNLCQLVKKYEITKTYGAHFPLIAWQINNRCSHAQLDALATELKKFIAPSSRPITLFSPHRGLYSIVTMIENGKPTADILLALKQKAQKKKDIDGLEPGVAILYGAINAFFSQTYTTQDKTMSDLLWRIRSTRMNDLTEGQSFEMVAMGSH